MGVIVRRLSNARNIKVLRIQLYFTIMAGATTTGQQYQISPKYYYNKIRIDAVHYFLLTAKTGKPHNLGDNFFNFQLFKSLKPQSNTISQSELRTVTSNHSSVCTDQVVIWSNAKKFSEVAKGNRSIGLKAKVAVVMSRSQVTAFTENTWARGRDIDKQ